MGETGELSGRTLGQYEIGSLLGEGGMAVVYEARQVSIGRTVAIKVMPSHTMRDAGFLARFEREVKVIADLQHPRVLPVYDFGHIENRPYIVMAYLSGGTLEDRIRQGAMPFDEARRLVQQMAEGLDFAHSKGIIHRDFKPANVLLDEQGNAHLADFGIARISASPMRLTESGIVGTPTYIAPEMLSGGEVTGAVDIYALGVTLYEMLAGTSPFAGDTPMRLITAHLYDPIPDIRIMRPELPEGVTYVIQRAMAKNPAHRFASAGKLAAALSDAAAGKSITPPPITDYRPITRQLGVPTTILPTRRAPAAIWFGLGSVVLIAAIIGLMAALGAFSGAGREAGENGEQVEESTRETATDEPIPTISGTALPFAPAGDDEVLVIVTDFEQEGVNADTRIYQALAQQVRTEQLEGVRVERLEGIRPLLQEDAVSIGEQYGATLVIWGTADSIGIQPRYEIVRNQDAITGGVALGASAGGDASSFSAYVTEGINSEFEFLMLYMLAQLAIANDQPDKAVDLLGDAMEIELGSAERELGLADASFLRCQTNRQLGNLEEAAADCTTALEVDEEMTPARYYRGVIYAELGQDAAALDDLNVVFNLSETSSANSYASMGMSMRDLGYYEAALVYFNKALEMEPENNYAILNRGTTYMLMEQFEPAMADINQAIAVLDNDYDTAHAYRDRALLNYYLGNHDAALSDADTAIEILPNNPWGYNQRALIRALLERDLELALEDANRAVDLAEGEAETLVYMLDTRAFVQYRLGEYDAALADVDLAADQVGPTWEHISALYFRYGMIYDAQGKTDEAIRHYQMYLEKPAAGGFIMNQIAVERLTALGGEIPEMP